MNLNSRGRVLNYFTPHTKYCPKAIQYELLFNSWIAINTIWNALPKSNSERLCEWNKKREKRSHRVSLPVSICCCSLCGAGVPVVSTEITTVSTKAGERETHRRSHKGGETLLNPLIIPSSTCLFFSSEHLQNMRTEDDRQAHTHTHTLGNSMY